MELTDMEKWLLYQIKGYEQYAVCKFFVIASGTVLGILSGIFFLIALNFLLKSFPFSIFPQ